MEVAKGGALIIRMEGMATTYKHLVGKPKRRFHL